jgi:restriction system protein
MGRRKSASPLEHLFEIAAMLPWWVGVALAAIAYIGFHIVAVSALPAVRPGQVIGIGNALWKGLSMGLQYIVPLVLLGGAAASAITRYKRRTLVSEVAGRRSAAVLKDVSWQEFEVLVSEAFKLQGFVVTDTGGGGPDGGVDLILRKGNEKFLVQCKQWRAFKVGVTTVRELYGVMAAQGAAGGYVVTSGKFTADAVEFSRGRNIELLDGEKLFAMFDRVRAGNAKMRGQVQQATARRVSSESRGGVTAPSCPTCGKEMVKRVAQKGANAGKPFWGCPAFPACRGTRPIA